MRDDRNVNLYYIDKDDMPLTELPYKEGYDVINGKQSFYATKTHMKILYSYMHDAPELQKSINEMMKPEHRELIKLAEDYHRAVCTDDSPCIVFEKKQPLVKLAADVLGGMTFFPKEFDVSAFSSGVLLNFWIPRRNEKFYLRTGLLFTKCDVRTENLRVNMYKFPFMLEYIYPKSVISPKIAYGYSFYYLDDNFADPMSISATCMGGFNIRLSDYIRLSFEYNIDFVTKDVIFILPERFLSHSFLGGLQIRF